MSKPRTQDVKSKSELCNVVTIFTYNTEKRHWFEAETGRMLVPTRAYALSSIIIFLKHLLLNLPLCVYYVYRIDHAHSTVCYSNYLGSSPMGSWAKARQFRSCRTEQLASVAAKPLFLMSLLFISHETIIITSSIWYLKELEYLHTERNDWILHHHFQM